MSQNSLTADLCRAARRARGKQANLTAKGREQALARFACFLWGAGYQLHLTGQLKEKHLSAWADAMRSRSLSARTIANNLAHARTALEGINRRPFANKMSNAKLGVVGASRDGTKRPMPGSVFEIYLAAARSLDAGVAAVLELEFEFGCRAQEAIMSPESLSGWERILANPLTDGFAEIVRGTKGGRSRRSPPLDRMRALGVIRRAIALCDERRGVLIQKPSLAQAMNRYHYVIRKLGMVGQCAPHSLRYAYATTHLEQMKAAGVPASAAASAVSTYLGHGDGRGRWVARVYGREALTSAEE